MWIEGMRNAQRIHKKNGKTVNGEEFRDGYEALDMSPARLKEIGIDGMIPPFKLSCADHQGAGKFKMMQWNGSKFDIISTDWVAPPDPAFIRKLIEESAAKYAAENNITPRKCQ
jgi:branched-chain amino acid transport system substrate-binding protein